MKFQRLRLIGSLTVAMLLLSTSATFAQEEKPAKTEAEKTEDVELEEIRPSIELGLFRVRDYRPTRNETIKMIFQMHIALNESATEQTAKQLKQWKHRLRNQVLIAVRLSERKDFLETDLSKFRHLIQIRINRLLKANLVDEVLLTEFTFTTN